MAIDVASLAEFDSPPVDEVALMVQFDELTKFETRHIGAVWEQFREQYPKSEEQSPVDPVKEMFEAGGKNFTSLQIASLPPIRRQWFKSEDDAELVQIQNDRFVRNWRKRDKEYPRYEVLCERFVKEYRVFANWAASQNIGALNLNQCEIAYVNHIVPCDTWQKASDSDKALRVLRENFSMYLPHNIEGFKLNFSCQVLDAAEKPYARMYIAAETVLRVKDRAPMMILRLTVRGAPKTPDLNGAVEFFSEGRKSIVGGFEQFTTEHIQKDWGKRRRTK